MLDLPLSFWESSRQQGLRKVIIRTYYTRLQKIENSTSPKFRHGFEYRKEYTADYSCFFLLKFVIRCFYTKPTKTFK